MNCIPYVSEDLNLGIILVLISLFKACDSALKSAEGYEHAKVGEWNSQIIVSINLRQMICLQAH
jgi:hypothetical protein